MNISKETALQIIDCLKKALDHADSSIHEARRVLGTEDAAHYRRLVGAVMGNTYLNHIRPLINLFPGLSMPGVESAAAAGSLDTFFSQIDFGLLRHRAQLEAGEAAGVFRPGSVQETTDAIEKLRAFAKEHPLVMRP